MSDDNQWRFADRSYRVVMGSDVHQRDGMFLELFDAHTMERGPLLEAFYSGETKDFTFTAWTQEDLPLDLVRQFVDEARARLPPTNS